MKMNYTQHVIDFVNNLHGKISAYPEKDSDYIRGYLSALEAVMTNIHCIAAGDETLTRHIPFSQRTEKEPIIEKENQNAEAEKEPEESCPETR